MIRRHDRMIAAALSWSVALSGVASAQVATDGADPRIQTVVYDAARTIRLRIAPGFVGTVILPADDVIETLGVGDGSAWQVKAGRRGDQFFVKPGPGAGISNLSVSTSRRRYNFILTPAPESDTEAMIQLTILLRAPDAPAPPVRATPDAAGQAPAARYRLSGPSRLRPLSITDDGRTTAIEWPATMPFPAILAIDRGREILINARIEGARAVVDRVWGEYVFRLDGDHARAVRVVPRRAARR